MSELIERTPTRELLDAAPEDRVSVATAIADQLKQVVDQQKLSVPISGKQHVLVEGWVTLGMLCGLTPREKSVEEHESGDVEAHVEIVRIADGSVIGGASAIVGADESTWQSRPRFARRSMAVTRATGKAFRLCLGWVMRLAGYDACPAEEMRDAIQFEMDAQPDPDTVRYVPDPPPPRPATPVSDLVHHGPVPLTEPREAEINTANVRAAINGAQSRQRLDQVSARLASVRQMLSEDDYKKMESLVLERRRALG